MSSAVFVRTKGRGLSFQLSIQARMSALRSRTERWLPRRSFSVVSSVNQRSTRLSHELEVGVKLEHEARMDKQPLFTAAFVASSPSVRTITRPRSATT
jgi:hypothetical protein